MYANNSRWFAIDPTSSLPWRKTAKVTLIFSKHMLMPWKVTLKPYYWNYSQKVNHVLFPSTQVCQKLQHSLGCHCLPRGSNVKYLILAVLPNTIYSSPRFLYFAFSLSSILLPVFCFKVSNQTIDTDSLEGSWNLACLWLILPLDFPFLIRGVHKMKNFHPLISIFKLFTSSS